ncbi:unnamed protein product, partial [Meganyctiphanes norvegica]
SAKIWERILALGTAEQSESTLEVVPTIFGERHDPSQNGSVTNIDLGNVSLGKVTKALCKGIVTNLHSMMPQSLLIDSGIIRIVGGGSALTRNPILQKELEAQYQLPVIMDARGDACYGAALVAIISRE